MWWRELRAAALALPLAACGFHPLYGERTALAWNPELAAVDVHPAANRLGQIATDEVRQQLNPRGVAIDPRYELIVTITEADSNLGIARDNTSSRGELLISAALTLHPRGSTRVMFTDSVRSTTAFNLSNDAYAATVAEDNARREAAVDLGREIALRVQLYFERQARGGT
jgi:LPS-assembly lipoprotein